MLRPSWLLPATAFILVPIGAMLLPRLGNGMDATDWEAAYRRNNLGVAHMEQHHYGKAAEEFRRVVAMAPRWVLGHINLAVALYSAHDNEGAESSFRQALAIEPASAHAHYGLGLIHKVRGEREQALAAFSRVAEIDPQDADSHYNLGLILQWDGRWEESARHLREAMALDPTNVSAVYKLATALLNAGQTGEGNVLMERFRAMSADPSLGSTRGLQYGEQGRYAEVGTEPPSRTSSGRDAPPASKARFVEAGAASGLGFQHLGPGPAPRKSDLFGDPRRAGSGVALGDADSDGDLDLCFAEVGGAKGPALRLYLNDGAGKFTDATHAAGLETGGTGLACTLGDLDNDKDLDLLLSAAEGARLFRNLGSGKFTESTREAGLAGAPAGGGAVAADADHDGDLDLFLASGGGVSAGSGASPGGAAPASPLWLNRGDGTFTRGTGEAAALLSARPQRGVVFTDFDNDRDIDFVVAGSGAVRLFSNQRGGRWEDVAAARGLPAAPGAHSAAVADLDKDGFMDLALPGAAAALLWRNDGGRRFEPLRPHGLPASPPSLGAVFLDYDNDGFVDLLSTGSGAQPPRLWRNLGGGRFADASEALGAEAGRAREVRGAAAGDLDRDGDLDLVLTRNGGAPLLLRNEGGNSRRWLMVRPQGLGSTRQGIGTKIEVQAGGLWQKAEIGGGSGYLSQNPAEALFGLGERPGAEFVRLLWPGGVLQSELEIAADRVLAVEELDRKGSSCPVLYAWDGSRFGFVNDLVGGGGVGFLVAPGRYSRPDPSEYVKIASEQLRPRDGWLELRVVQQLEEVAYIDRLELIAVDHPAETEIFPNERFMTAPPYPELEVYEVHERILPTAAHDGAGRDCSAALREADRVYADGLELLRWPGYAAPHELVLEFGPEAAGHGWKIFLNGWVDYGYSHANYAAAQAGLGLSPPRLEAPGPGGGWQVLSDNLGYPAGLNRTMVGAAEAGWEGGDRRLRLSTNMRIYWDQIYLARPRRIDPRRLPRLAAAGAELRFLGFPREFSPDGRRPYIYDYSLAASSFPWKNMRGRFTRYGDVRELVASSDDRFVIMNRGDEIALRFAARDIPPLAAGFRRDYLLCADGYAKDMDPHGAFPDTVEPLPFHAMSGYPYGPGERYPEDPLHRDYQRRWNTRTLWED